MPETRFLGAIADFKLIKFEICNLKSEIFNAPRKLIKLLTTPIVLLLNYSRIIHAAGRIRTYDLSVGLCV